MTIISWSYNHATGKYEGCGYDDLGNAIRIPEEEQLTLPLPLPPDPGDPSPLPQLDD